MEKIIILIILSLIFVSGCSVQESEQNVINPESIEIKEAEIIDLESDKEIYSSGEIIQLSAKVKGIEEGNVSFYGISGKLDLKAEIKEGFAKLNYTAPRCYGCSGIKQGIYPINAEILYEGRKLDSESIEIEMIR